MLPCVLLPDMFALPIFAKPTMFAVPDLTNPFNVVILPEDTICITSLMFPIFALAVTLNTEPVKLALPVASMCNEVNVPVMFEVCALINPVLAYKLPVVSKLATLATPVMFACCVFR